MRNFGCQFVLCLMISLPFTKWAEARVLAIDGLLPPYRHAAKHFRGYPVARQCGSLPIGLT